MTRRFFIPTLLLAVLAFATTKTAHAYVDPGTTTSVFGIVVAALSGLGAIGAFLIRPLKNLLRRKKDVAAPTPAPKPPDASKPGSE